MRILAVFLVALIFEVTVSTVSSGQILLRRPDGSPQQDSTNTNFVVDAKRLQPGEKNGLGPSDLAHITSYAPTLAAVLFAFDDGKSVVRIITTRNAPTLSAPLCEPAENVLFEFQTDTPARYLPVESTVPQPSTSRPSAADPAEILVQVVVDTNGQTDMASFKTLRAPSDMIAYAVRAVAPGWQFSPALKRGCRVRQLAQVTVAVSH